MALSDVTIRQAKPSDKPYKLSDGAGLYLLVNSSGKYWRWKYRFDGKEKTMALGVYPAVSLAQARKRHQEARATLGDGVDPMEQKKAATAPVLTFEDVSRQWWNHWKAERNAQYAAYTMRRLEQDVFPAIGELPAQTIPASAFRDVVKAIEARGALDIARKLLQTCSQIMRYAVAHDLAERNPVADVRPSDILKARKTRNHARVTEKELPNLLRAIDCYAGSEHTALAMKLMVLTFVRTSELIGARWEEFDLDAARWDIPAERMKMKAPHIVPLSRQALAILARLKAISYGRELLFPGAANPKKTMSSNTILYALYRIGYHGRMTGHGFRGVASTILHEYGWTHEHIELQLAHQERDAISAAYNHAQYLKPRAKMMQWWSDYIESQTRDNPVIIGNFARAA